MNQLFSSEIYINRRKKLKQSLGSGQFLFMGNSEAPMNYKSNTYRFRQDSTFLYFFGLNLPDLYALIDTEKEQTLLFGEDWTVDDVIWSGPRQSLPELAMRVGISEIRKTKEIETLLQSSSEVHFLPPYRDDNKIRLSHWLGIPISQVSEKASISFIQSVIKQRAYKSEEEIRAMSSAVDTSRQMHLTAIQSAKQGKYEYEVVADLTMEALRKRAQLAYSPILSNQGQTLHNHNYHHKLKEGDLILNDSGAEGAFFYASDITRTFPVANTFSSRQKDIYEIVLEMEETAIQSLIPGLSYRDVHVEANRLMLTRLKSLNLVEGDVDEMLAEGVGGLFMPHGLGHAIGLDVHDMEDLGEQYVGYEIGQARSEQLGLKSLRFAKKLEPGNTLTVEPGIYFIPELIEKMKAEGRFKSFVNYSALANYYDFGGIRIEDNVLITPSGVQILGNFPIPKQVAEIEALKKQ